MFAIWQALRALEQRRESGREYTIFVDSTSPIKRVRDDAWGPGQRFGIAAIEVETRLAAAGNRVTIRWVPAHAGAEGNEVADRYAKDAATGRAPRGELPEGYAEETSLAHMTRVVTEARSVAKTKEVTWLILFYLDSTSSYIHVLRGMRPARYSGGLFSGALLRCAHQRRASPVRHSPARFSGDLILQ